MSKLKAGTDGGCGQSRTGTGRLGMGHRRRDLGVGKLSTN